MDFSGHKVIVAVFSMEGCEACEDFVPRLHIRARARGLSVLRLDKGESVSTEASRQICLPVLVIDANDKRFADWADKLKVHATPTTYILRRPRGMQKYEGALPDLQIDQILNTALRNLTCSGLVYG